MKSKFIDTFLKPLFTGEKASGECVFRKTYTKEGRLFGVVDGRMEANIVGVQGVPSDELRDGNRIEKEFNLDRCIDGTSPEATSTTKMTFVSVFSFARSKIVTTTTSKMELLAK